MCSLNRAPVLLDEQNCLMLHELWLQSGTGQRRWEGLPDEVRETITVHFTAKRGDWCGFWSNEDVSVWWNRLCDNVLPEKTMPFDLLTVLPTRLDVEVNGFNGGVLNGVPSAYHWYTEQYGVKWPVGYEVNISRQGENFIQVDFDTPWCQPESNVVAELSRRFGCTLEHWYAEQGCNFCGWQGSDMSVESLLMCCGGNWNGLPRQMMMSCRKSPRRSG